MGFAIVPRVPHGARPIQVRFFQEADLAQLETEINAWLAEDARREIVDIRQSIGGQNARDILVSVWYVKA
jgi:hypothetical protein